MTDRLTEEMETRRKMADKLSHERHQGQKEKECTQEVGLLSLCAAQAVVCLHNIATYLFCYQLKK